MGGRFVDIAPSCSRMETVLRDVGWTRGAGMDEDGFVVVTRAAERFCTARRAEIWAKIMTRNNTRMMCGIIIESSIGLDAIVAAAGRIAWIINGAPLSITATAVPPYLQPLHLFHSRLLLFELFDRHFLALHSSERNARPPLPPLTSRPRPRPRHTLLPPLRQSLHQLLSLVPAAAKAEGRRAKSSAPRHPLSPPQGRPFASHDTRSSLIVSHHNRSAHDKEAASFTIVRPAHFTRPSTTTHVAGLPT